MLAAILLLQTAPAAPPRPPQDWTALPQLRFVAPPRTDAKLSLFVRREVAAGRCAAAERGSQGWSLRVDFAVRLDEHGRARQAVPRAIGCPTVEQFAAGALSRLVRDNVYPLGPEGGWAKTALSFTWTG